MRLLYKVYKNLGLIGNINVKDPILNRLCELKDCTSQWINKAYDTVIPLKKKGTEFISKVSSIASRVFDKCEIPLINTFCFWSIYRIIPQGELQPPKLLFIRINYLLGCSVYADQRNLAEYNKDLVKPMYALATDYAIRTVVTKDPLTGVLAAIFATTGTISLLRSQSKTFRLATDKYKFLRPFIGNRLPNVNQI